MPKATSMNKPLLFALCLLQPSLAHADGPADERRRLLDEGSRQTQQYRESGWLDTEQARGEVEENDGYISIGGEIYQVGDTAEELESAIYHALNARQWHMCGSSPPATPNCPGTSPR